MSSHPNITAANPHRVRSESTKSTQSDSDPKSDEFTDPYCPVVNNSVNSSYLPGETSPLLAKRKETKGLLALGYALFLILGIAPQLVQNALFSETPIFRQHLPEGKAISAAIVTTFMIANVAALVYLLIQSVKPLSDKIFIWIILVLSVAAAVVTAIFWDYTAYIFGARRSVVMYIMAFVAGMVGNTSTLVFFAFASQFKPLFTTALSTGYGVSGVITSAIAIGQNPDHPNFGVPVFFGIMLAVLVIGIASFVIITRNSITRDFVSDEHADSDAVDGSSPNESAVDGESGVAVAEATDTLEPLGFAALFRQSVFSLFNMLWVSTLTFFMPGLIAYMTSDKDTMGYLNAIFLVGPPIGAACAGVYKFYYLAVPNALQTVIFVYILLPLLAPTHGVLPTQSWLLYILMSVFSIISGYSTTMIYLRVRRDTDISDVEKVSRWAAFTNQIGATLGIVANDIVIDHNALHQF